MAGRSRSRALLGDLPVAEQERLRARRKRWEKMRVMGRPGRVLPDEFEAARTLLGRARRYGMSDALIASQTGLEEGAVRDIRCGRTAFMWRSTYDKIMTLRPDRVSSRPDPVRGKVPEGPPVSAVGTNRRLQALRADGFPNTFLASELGVSHQAVSELARHEPAYMYYTTYAEVKALYSKLETVRPADVGVPSFSAARTSTYARNHGWAPRSCWDEGTIDDPDALPDWTGFCGRSLGPLIHERDGIPLCDRCQDVSPPVFSGTKLRELREGAALSQNELASRAGLSRGVVHHYEVGRYAPRLKRVNAMLSVLDACLDDVYESEET